MLAQSQLKQLTIDALEEVKSRLILFCLSCACSCLVRGAED